MDSVLIREKKANAISRIDNARLVDNVSSDWAKIALPDSNDFHILNLVKSKLMQEANDLTGGHIQPNNGLEKLHESLSVEDIPELQSRINEALQLEMMRWAANVSRNRLGFKGNFWIDKAIYVRINFPFDFACNGQRSDVTDPDHRLTQYNKGRPRATWGHGPHKDSWYGHSHSAINLWFSICGTNEAATMTLYPEHTYRETAFDPDSMYASYSEDLGKNVTISLAEGENFIFDPELLHSSRVNTSRETRIVLTLRVSQIEPVFSDSIAHEVYDEWIDSGNIDEGNIKPRKIGVKVPIGDYPEAKKNANIKVIEVGGSIEFDAAAASRSDFDVPDNVIFELAAADKSCLAVWCQDELFRFAKNCPHIGAPLAMGKFDPKMKTIKCPAHGAEFSLETGCSGANKLNLKVY